MARMIECFAGLGSMGLRCLWESAGSDPRMRWEPPVSRQGSKSGFVINEFRAFGLFRQKWDAVLLNDLDPVCHLFHMLYASSELRDLVARKLFAMVPCPECLPADVRWALEGKLKPTPAMCKGKEGCPLCSGTGVMDARQLWEKIRKEPVPGDLVEACAAGLFMQARAFSLSPVSANENGWQQAGGFNPEFRPPNHGGLPRDDIASRVSLLPGPGGCHIGISRLDALEFVRGLVLTPDDIVICDPPYEGTSGYQAQSCRADVLEIARMGHEAGALVLLHESVGLAKELGKGWHQRSASPLRGRSSTFFKDGIEKEVLTSNRSPIWWPAEQGRLF